ncbi:MAG: hypothetical protein M3437_04900 [Chloroflexota bacterium]|nr:hypothetical protein [Chloroflexota bacterium]MDQ5866995.1 hypothetical protein [Chloroflexota bacterium]
MAIAQPLTIDEQAPDFNLDTPDGRQITLAKLTAQRTLIILQRHLG